GFGASSDRNGTGSGAGDSVTISDAWRRPSAATTGSCFRSKFTAVPIVRPPTGSPALSSAASLAANDASAAMRQDANVTDRIGRASRLATATLQTRCLDAADALRNTAAIKPAADKITALLMKVSSSSWINAIDCDDSPVIFTFLPSWLPRSVAKACP